jgi:hypothetical protein
MGIMRRSVVVTTAVAFVVAFADPTATSAEGVATAACAPARTQIVAADSQAEVFIAREPYYSEEGSHARLGTLVSYRGCAYGSRRSFRLGIVGVGSSRGGVSTEHITLAGAFVAYETGRVVTEIESDLHVVVRNLRTGRTLTDVPTGVPLRSRPHYAGVGDVRTMVLNSSGAVAWIATDDLRSEGVERETGHEANYYDLYSVDRTGERLLASGTELDPHSLALGGSTLYWMLGGKPFSASLG